MDYHIKLPIWEQLFPILKTFSEIRIGSEVRLRICIKAMEYIATTRCQWRRLPAAYGCFRAVKRWRVIRSLDKSLLSLFRMLQTCSKLLWTQRLLEPMLAPQDISEILNLNNLLNEVEEGFLQKFMLSSMRWDIL